MLDDNRVIVMIDDDEVTAVHGGKKVAVLVGMPHFVCGRTPLSSHHAWVMVDALYIIQDESATEGFWVDENSGIKYVLNPAGFIYEKVVVLMITNSTLVDPTTLQESSNPDAIGEFNAYWSYMKEYPLVPTFITQIAAHNQRPDDKNKFKLPVNGKDIKLKNG